MTIDKSSRWVSYDEAGGLLGLSPEGAMRMALRRGWPRRAAPGGAAQVAISPTSSVDEDEDALGPAAGGARTLLDNLELRVDQLTEELAEARTEMRGLRYEAESLRTDAARAQVFAVLVDAERARSAELKAERDRLARVLVEDRRPWLAGLIRCLGFAPTAERTS